MNPILELIPISDLRQRQSVVLGEVEHAPVILTQYGRAVAVLVSPAQWNELVSELEDLRDALDAAEVRQDSAPLMDFDEYLIQRGDVVPVVVGKTSGCSRLRPGLGGLKDSFTMILLASCLVHPDRRLKPRQPITKSADADWWP